MKPRSLPGLDLDHLRGLRTSRRDLGSVRKRIEQHLDAHQGYVAFSGGKDSLVVLHLAVGVDPEVPVVFFDSGLEFPETYQYLEQLCDLWRLNMTVVPAQLSTLEVLQRSGLWTHAPAAPVEQWNLHEVLIAEPARRAHAAFGAGELWGVRAEESKGRAAAYANALRSHQACECCDGESARRRVHGGRIARVDGTVAFGPVWDWSTAEIWGYIARNGLPANPVYAKLRRLGAPEAFLRVSHMLDGSRLNEGRLMWLQRGWPTIFNELAGVLPRVREFL